MAGDRDQADALRQQVVRAYEGHTPLRISGGGSKAFYGRPTDGIPLDVSGHRGVLSYEPTELVLTARAGTPLAEIEKMLAAQGQMLAFEPPHWGDGATLGGTVACNLSGPRRPFAGAARDFVLGCRIINGRGEKLHFGGEVMKNVAGYDAARLMAGAFGTLGVLLDVSLKVLPAPERELTLVQSCLPEQALAQMNRLAGQPLPLSASAWADGRLYLRLSGAASAIDTFRERLPGDILPEVSSFWTDLRERKLPFFADARPLWRLSLPPSAPPPEIAGDWLIDWSGGQRWLATDALAEQVRGAVAALGGHAILFHADASAVDFHPLADGLWPLHQRLKQAFDPTAILNSGRMYAGL
jgi:glycolate oxidase FAD binding subunit